MRITRIGLAPLKGCRHVSVRHAAIDHDGVVGDRRWCLLDPDTRRVLRTVENPSLTRLSVSTDGHAVRIRTPERLLSTVRTAGMRMRVTADYWGRPATLHVADVAPDPALTAYLGRPALLARAERGHVVYADPVSVLTTGALADLTARIESGGGTPAADLDTRFRSNLTLDLDHDPAPGTRITLGEAEIEITSPIERCAVVDIDPAPSAQDRGAPDRGAPASGAQDRGAPGRTRMLAHLVDERGRVVFGMGARVLRPGTVSVAAAALPRPC